MKKLLILLFTLQYSLFISAAISFSMTEEAANQNTPDGWASVQLPTGIPTITDANTFIITDAPYNASTSSGDNTAAIQAALDAAAEAGGGMVVIPEGEFLSGCLTMGSKTILHLCANATLKMLPISSFSTDGNGYHKMDNPFITGKSGASDIVIEGESRETSIIDGQGASWWDEVEVAKASKKSTTRQAMIRFWQGSRYLFRNFRVQNAPNTNITIGRNGTGSHATVHDITIKNPSSEADDPSHNTDGFPIWTQYVNIYDTEIDTGDDNIVCDEDAQFVHVWHCDLKEGHGASFGSYTTNMHDIIYEDLTLTNTDAGFRLKSNNDRSGDVYNIIFRNVTMTNVANPINITCWYDSLPQSPEYIDLHPHDSTPKTPAFHDILIQNVTASGDTKYKMGNSNPDKDRKYFGVFIYGRPESYVRNVTFDNVNITHSKGMRLNFCDGILFKNCSFTVYNTTSGYIGYNCSSTEDGLPALMFEERDEFIYKGAYNWKAGSGVDASFAWLVGNESAATITSDADSYVSNTKVTTGTGLTTGTNNTYAANSGNAMVTYQPATSKPGSVAAVMIEYSIEMKKGTTFRLKGVNYDAIKEGTNDATYSWSYTVDGVESAIKTVSKDDILRNDNSNAATAQLRHNETISGAAAGKKVTVRFYVSGFADNKKFALSNLQINGVILGEPEGRSFTDFKIEFRDNPRTILLPTSGELPEGVTVTNTSYNGSQHGIYGGTITVPVDGPVRFTIGACQHSKHLITVKKNGEAFTTISNVAACGEQKPNYNQYVTWLYNSEEAATLTFELGSQTYLPYFFAEATEFVPQVEVKYYDSDGKTLIGSEMIEGGSALTYLYNASNVTVADGDAFRGWFNSADPTATKVPEGTLVTESLKLYAHTSAIEVATIGSIFEYDLRQNYFYPEDHELLTLNGGAYNDGQHGWRFGNGNTLSIDVAGNALLNVGVCRYSATGTTDVKDAVGNKVGELSVVNNSTPDGSEQTIRYTGEATTLTFYFTATNYIHRIMVFNVQEMPSKNDAGYYVLAPNDGAALTLTLKMLESGDKIFLPNGTYDFGEAVLTAINATNVSLIGQSMEGTIIKNKPLAENINNTATILISGSAENTYMQDLTLKNDLDYYTFIEQTSNGRAIALEDDGTHTICKNVRLLSYQDTYYTHHGSGGAVNYFEDCEIHGTVDYICGNGTVYFKNNLLYNEQHNRNDRKGTDYITAHNGSADEKGYVFEGCTIVSDCDVVSFGRAWNYKPKAAFLNSIVDFSQGAFSFSDSEGKTQRWTKELMNPMSTCAWPEFWEYNTTGDASNPASNVVTFIDKSPGTTTENIETVLTAEQAANYSYANILGSWDPAAEAVQATADPKAIDADAAYLVEDGEGAFVALVKGSALTSYIGKYIRKANARGGFGERVYYTDSSTDIDPISQQPTASSQKLMKDGQLFIIRGDKTYTVTGQQIK